MPQFWGLYLRTGEEIVELHADVVEGGGLSSLTPRAVNTPTPSLILYHDQYSPHRLQLTQLQYVFQMEGKAGWVPTTSIPLKIAPIEGKQSMYLIAPSTALSNGVYAAHFGSLSGDNAVLEDHAYVFVVGQSEYVIDLTIHRTKAKEYALQSDTWNHAIAEYQYALKITPEDATLQEKLALLYYQKQDYHEAIKAFHRLQTIAPYRAGVKEKLMETYLQFGRHLIDEQRYPSALEHLSQALSIAEQSFPEKVAVISGLQAEIYYQQGEFEQAFEKAQYAVEQDSPSSTPYVILSFLNQRQGQQKDAVQLLNQALQKGLGNNVGGHLFVNTGYGNLTIPVQDADSVSLEEVKLKSGEMFKGHVQFTAE